MRYLLVFKRILSIVGCVAVLSACTYPAKPSGWRTEREETSRPESLTAPMSVFHNKNGIEGERIEEVCRRFTEGTGIEIHVEAPGSSYEETLKTKMASNSLPDVFTTHGWSVKRYSSYLRPLNDQPWADRLRPQARMVTTDKQGRLFVLPVSIYQEGLTYNAEILEKCGIDPSKLRTWTAFEEALQVIRDHGYVPIAFGGKDPWTIAMFIDCLATSYFDQYVMENARQALLSGEFDWYLWRPVCERLYKWSEQGFIDIDSLTWDYDMAAREYGAGNIAFSPATSIYDAMRYAPEARFGMIPVPSYNSAQPPFLLGGEDVCLGVWKESPWLAEGLSFLEFCARPEICETIVNVSNSFPGLKDIEPPEGPLRTFYYQYRGIRSRNYFDREYLPGGMWDDMSATGAMLISNNPGCVDEVVAYMEKSYREKMS